MNSATWGAALVCLALPLGAQDSSYSELRLRVSGLTNPVSGPISDDWHPRVGKQVEVATPLEVGEFGLAIGRVHYTPQTGHPAYDATLFTLTWTLPEATLSQLHVTAGLRLTDYRMDFDDPAIGVGLRTEEEVLPGIIGRVRLPTVGRLSVVADASYGILMLSHRTPMVLLTIGAQYGVTTPGWLRDMLR